MHSIIKWKEENKIENPFFFVLADLLRKIDNQIKQKKNHFFQQKKKQKKNYFSLCFYVRSIFFLFEHDNKKGNM